MNKPNEKKNIYSWIWLNRKIIRKRWKMAFTSWHGWKIRPSGSWPSPFVNFGSSSFFACDTSQKHFSRTLNGSRCLSIRPNFIALWRGSGMNKTQKWHHFTIHHYYLNDGTVLPIIIIIIITDDIFTHAFNPADYWRLIRIKFIFHVAASVEVDNVIDKIPRYA